MAALDLSDLGLKVTLGRTARDADVVSVSQEFTIEDAGLQAAMAEFRVAAEEFAAAWAAVPVGVREWCDGLTVTLHAHPADPL